MNAIIILFTVGALLIGFEVVVPGGILGLLGGIALFGGVAMSFYDHGLNGGFIALLVALGLTGIVLWLEFRLLPRTALGRRMFLHAAVTGTTTAAVEDLAGRVGHAVTALGPSGYVLIEGKQYEAFSRAGFVEAGTAVKVISADNFRLIVTLEK
ncbi:MAG: NfeD family protein [Opitutaceae bacterium]|nr:NfeD family protein [Opitutaceae bacterium]